MSTSACLLCFNIVHMQTCLPELLVFVHFQVNLRGEIPNLVLLVVLYAMQGVPLGLTLGSM